MGKSRPDDRPGGFLCQGLEWDGCIVRDGEPKLTKVHSFSSRKYCCPHFGTLWVKDSVDFRCGDLLGRGLLGALVKDAGVQIG